MRAPKNDRLTKKNLDEQLDKLFTEMTDFAKASGIDGEESSGTDSSDEEFVAFHTKGSSPVVIKGSINGIWLTQKNGSLHKAILPNLASWVEDAKKANFQVVLWTDKNVLLGSEIRALEEKGILVNDCSLCASSRFYPYFSFFLEKAIAGDKTAFALASDILRMAILELSPSSDYFIYVDPNDVHLLDLKNNLSSLHAKMNQNSLGFSFYVSPMFGRKDLFQKRNDLLIALKQINPNFFNDYFNAYQNQLEQNHRDYVKPQKDGEAQALALKISMQTSDTFFQIYVQSGIVFSKFGPYKEVWSKIHAENFLSHQRNQQNGNSWLPIGNLQEEKTELAKFGIPLPTVSSDAELKSEHSLYAQLLSAINTLDLLAATQSRIRSDAGFKLFRGLEEQMDYFPAYPLAKRGEKKEIVQDPTNPTSYSLRLYPKVLLRVKNLGSAQEQFETLYFDDNLQRIRSRKSCTKYELPVIKEALEEYFKNKNALLATETETHSMDP